MAAPGLTLFALLFAQADPVFIRSVDGTQEGGRLNLNIVGEKPLDAQNASGKVTPEGVSIYVEGGLARRDNITWETGGLTIVARRRQDRIKLEIAVPPGMACRAPVRITGTEDGRLLVAASCSPTDAGILADAMKPAGDPSIGKASPAKPAGDPEPAVAPSEPSTGKSGREPASGLAGEKASAASRAEAALQPRSDPPEPSSGVLGGAVPWATAVGFLLMVILFMGLRRNPPGRPPEPVEAAVLRGDPVKVLMVAQIEGRHFLVGETSSNTAIVREATAANASSRQVQEVLLTPVGGRKLGNAQHPGESDSADTRLLARLYGDRSTENKPKAP